MTTPEIPLTPDGHQRTFRALSELASRYGIEAEDQVREIDFVDQEELPLGELPPVESTRVVLKIEEAGSVPETFNDLVPGEQLAEARLALTTYENDLPSEASLTATSTDPSKRIYTRVFSLSGTDKPNLEIDATVDMSIDDVDGKPIRFLDASGESVVEESKPMTDRQARFVQTVAALLALHRGLENPF